MPNYDFSVKVAFVELYKEQLYDLLSTQVRRHLFAELTNFHLSPSAALVFFDNLFDNLSHFCFYF